jgi:hypothetical protein
MLFPGRNASIDFYVKQLDMQNIRSIAQRLQQEKSEYNDVTRIWVEAVLIELMKKEMLLKFKGD